MRVLLEDIIQWDVRNWSVAFDFWRQHGGFERGGYECLEIGANRGGVSAWLASFGNRVLCSDWRDAEAKARPLIERYDLLEQVRFENIDATSIPYENAFDLIVFKSVLGGVGHHGIERQARAISEMHRALKHGGKLLFAENLTGSPLHRFLRRHFAEWGERWRYPTVPEMSDFLRLFRDARMQTTGVLGMLGRSEAQRRMLAAIDRAGLSAAVPSDWRYIVYGVAVK